MINQMSGDGAKSSYKSLIVGAIGVVYGDIGTSPLYALKSCFSMGGLAVTEGNIFGLISLFIWALLLIVSLKYVHLVLNFQHQGEGGVLILSSLCAKLYKGQHKALPITLGIIGATLFFSDGIITPAISILSAVEGVEVLVPRASGYTIWLAIGIILLLFVSQHYGSGRLGRYFGPIMIIWFLVLSISGLYQIIQRPEIMAAFSPHYALQFLYNHGWQSIVVMGGVILVVTGAEAMYADLGHFGKNPIKMAWTWFICPALLLNYLGQGALLLYSPEAIASPFYMMVPPVLLSPLIVLSTVSTIIASQSILSGIFSISWQGIMLDYLPRMRVVHTSYQYIGQVYVPFINLLVCFLTITATWHFGSSHKLAVAYGLSVSGVMILTSIMIAVTAYYKWNWSWYQLLLLFVPLLALELLFVLSNMVKMVEGAWYTVLISWAAVYVVFTWRRGNRLVHAHKSLLHHDLGSYIAAYSKHYEQRIPSTAIFMCRCPGKVPDALLIHLEHNKLLHQKILFLSVAITNVPTVQSEKRHKLRVLQDNMWYATVCYGFGEVPNLLKVISWMQNQGLVGVDESISFFFSRDTAVHSSHGLKGLTEELYLYLHKNASAAYEFYKVPDEKMLELVVRRQV